MFVSRIFVFFTLTIVFSCISSIHGWLFYKKSYYPYATREYNTNSAASGQSQQHQSQANPHHPVGVAPSNSWSPMSSGSGVYYNEGIPGGVPMAMAVPVAIPVLKDGIPTGMYVNPHGSIQDVPLYSQPGSSARPQGLPVVNHQSQDLKYAYGPCMCPVAYTTRVEAVETPAPEPQTTHPATPTRETYVVQPAGTTTS